MPLSRLLEEGGVAIDEAPDFGELPDREYKYLHVVMPRHYPFS